MTTCVGKNFIPCTMCVFRECLWMSVCVSFPFGFTGGIWDLIVLAPIHFLSFYFSSKCI